MSSISSKIFKLSIIIVLLAANTNAQAGSTQICNQMPFWIEYASENSEYPFEQPSTSNYGYSVGWHAIAPNDCESVYFSGDNGHVVYARSQGFEEGVVRAGWQWGYVNDYNVGNGAGTCVMLNKENYSLSYDRGVIAYPSIIYDPAMPQCHEISGASLVVGRFFMGGETWNISDSPDITIVRGNYPLPTITFSVDRDVQYIGEYLNFNWSADFADSCEAGGEWSGNNLPTSGAQTWGPLTSVGLKTYTITCTSSEGSVTKSVSVQQQNTGPTITIDSPGQGSVLYTGTPVTISATAKDKNDVDISNNINWASIPLLKTPLPKNVSSFTHTFNSTGSYTFIATVTDDGVTASTNRTFELKSALDLTIESSVGVLFDINETIQFQASVVFQGQNSTAAHISWHSDIDGFLGEGYTLDKNGLSEGTHTIVATATQSGYSIQEQLLIIAYDSQENLGDQNDGNCLATNLWRMATGKSGNISSPVNLLSGNKYHSETDFTTNTESPIYIKRSYNSASNKIGLFGYGWTSNIEEHVDYDATAEQASVQNDSGAVQRFNLVDGQWVDESSSKAELERLPDNSWRYTLYKGTVKTYDSDGQILSVTAPNGLTITYHYLNDMLESISDEYGYSISFVHNTDGYISEVSDPDNYTYQYEYSNNNLVKVIYPDKTPAITSDNPRKTYLYENVRYPHALTGLLDEEGVRYATWAYDEVGRVYFSKLGTDVQSASISYNADGTVTTSNALNKQTTYHYTSVKGLLKVTGVTGHQSENCAATFQSITYDPDTGFADTKTDWRGNQILLDHNEFGQVTSKTVVDTGAGWTVPIDERVTVTTSYNANRLPEVVTQPGVTVTRGYTPNQRLKSVEAVDTTNHTLPYVTNGDTRKTTYDYSFHANTDVVQYVDIDGPRSDVNDVIRNEYDNQGNLIRTTNPLSHDVVYSDYNSRGLPGRMVDANGVVTLFEYTARGWLTKQTVQSAKGNAVTTYQYYKNGLIKSVTQPNGATLNYVYNDARQLDYIENNLGERQDYDPNVLNGEWEKVTYETSAGELRFEKSRAFDELGRVSFLTSPLGHDISYQHDPAGNITKEIQRISQQGQSTYYRVVDKYYDVFNRVRRIEAIDQATTLYDFDAAGNLSKVTVLGDSDQITQYLYNGFGERIYENSPATGELTIYYDAAGNITRSIDSNTHETVKTYDAINRLQAISYTGASAEDVLYTYDNGNYAVGRLSGITDQSGTQTLNYDAQGFIDTIDYAIGASSYVMDYDIDVNGQLEKVTYPTGLQIYYRYDDLGRVSGIDSNSAASLLLDSVNYEPYGPISSYTFGNGLSRDVDYDQVYRVDAIHNAWLTYQDMVDYGYDNADRLTSMALSTHNQISKSQWSKKIFEYDRADRLTASRWNMHNAKNYSGNENREYDYDAAGNRIEKRLSSAGAIKAWRYAINGATNQINTISKADDGVNFAQTHAYSYRNSGELQTDGNRLYTYNRARRLTEVNEGASILGRYIYNAHGQRVQKQANGKTIQFHYDLQGNLIAETNTAGELVRQYVYIGNTPVAMLAGDDLYDDVPSDSTSLIGSDTFQVDSKNTRSNALYAVQGDTEVSARLSDYSNHIGEEQLGLTIREEQNGASGARLDVYFAAQNHSTMHNIYAKTPDGKDLIIPLFGARTDGEKLKIDITAAGGSTTQEEYARDGDWLKLERAGAFVNVYTSSDGQNWTLLRAVNLPMLDDAYMGAISQNVKAGIDVNYKVPNDNIFYLHTDHLNSVVAVSGNASKARVWQRNDFELGASAFGQNDLANGEKLHSGAFEMPLRFPGQYHDTETDTHYNYFRDYNPSTGRYLQSDPIGLKGGANTYGYVYGNPIQYVDPTGEFGMFGTALLGAAIGGVLNVYAQLNSGNEFEWSRFWTSVGVGAAGGLVGNILAGGSVAGISLTLSTGRQIAYNAVAGGVISASATAAHNVVMDSNDCILESFGWGFAGGALGSSFGFVTSPLYRNAREALRTFGRQRTPYLVRSLFDSVDFPSYQPTPFDRFSAGAFEVGAHMISNSDLSNIFED